MEKIKMTTERLFLRSPNINVCFRIEIEGDFTQNDFAQAVDAVCKRHPLVTCAVEIDGNHDAWFVQNANPVEVVYYTHEEMPDWKDWYKKTDALPFDLTRGPLVKICVITGNNHTEIITLGHHVIGDGIGYLNLVKDILLALDGRLEAAARMPPANNKFIKGKKLGLLSRLYAQKLNKEWRKNKTHFSEDEYRAFFMDYRAKYIPQIYIDSINEDALKRITALCKRNKLTVNELLTAAFATAVADAGAGADFAGKETRIGVAASTRGEAAAKPWYCMGNYVTGISVTAACGSTNDFMANVKTITKLVRGELTNIKKKHAVVNFLGEFDNDLIESIMFASYGNYELPIAKKIGTIIAEGLEEKGLGVSNLGRHELNNYSKFRVSGLQFIGPAFPANLLSVSIITVNNTCTLCLRYNEPEIKLDAVKMVYKKALELIFNE
ncbi:MAG: condensation domain-containing protein [Spirochaetaceae bacterium]|jgi:NRPS condensation-like uncharacterized protein|nr:condensation domain-containing protein [Spirochaetaceae bacterium]